MPRLHRFTVAPALMGLMALAAVSAPAAAQSTASASINATANVSGVVPLSIAGVNDLDFGTVNAGTSKTPTSLSANAGRFNVAGQPGTSVNLTFGLPSALTGPGGSIGVAFGANDGLIWTAFPSTFTSFNPGAPFSTPLHAVSGTLVVGISGTVTAPAGTTTGTYTGTVSLTVAY